MLPIFHMTSDGQLNLQVNFLREKELPKQVMRDMIVKMESNFLRDYDTSSYPVDSYEEMEYMFHTYNQVDKFLSTVEGVVYRLKQ
jgi:predicted KAP-like P-loop ATPase